MAITASNTSLGNGKVSTNQISVSASTNAAVASGDLLVAAFAIWSASKTLDSVAGGGLSWTVHGGGPGVTGAPSIYWASAFTSGLLASGASVTGTFSAVDDTLVVNLFSLSGVDPTTRIDVAPASTWGGASHTDWVTPSTAISAGAALIGASSNESNVTSSTTTYTELFDAPDNWGGGFTAAMRVEPSAGSYTVGGTWGGPVQEVTSVIAFKAAAGGGSSPVGLARSRPLIVV